MDGLHLPACCGSALRSALGILNNLSLLPDSPALPSQLVVSSVAAGKQEMSYLIFMAAAPRPTTTICCHTQAGSAIT